MKRVISILLGIVMMISLAACGNSATDQTAKDTASGEEAVENKGESPEASDNPADWPVISVDVLSFTDMLDRKDEVQKALNDYLVSINAGVQAEFIVNSWGDRSNNLTMLLTDNDNPIDLFCWRFYSSVDALVKNDQVIPLEGYKDTYPELWTMFPEPVYLTCQINGEQDRKSVV